MLPVCTRVRIENANGPQEVAIDAAMLERVHKVTRELNEDGLRMVAVAMKETLASRLTYSVADESELILVGYIAFLDSPKESTAPALRALANNGVNVKVLTGDNELVTARVCGQVGLAVGTILLGPQIERMIDTALAHAVEVHQVFAKLTPLHKERLVRALRANGHVVGFMGDGINDAPALRAADIGISVNSAVDITKEAADIILLEKSLMVLEEGVIEGRRTFSNMLKYIRMTASSNFGNVFSVLVASAFLPFLPMLPLHGVLRPVSSIFDITTFTLMWLVFHANTPVQETLFQSGWFNQGLLTQTLIVHMIRTPKLPFIESRAAVPLIIMTVAVMAAGVLLPMGPLAGYFKLQALPSGYFLWLFATLIGYAVLTTVMKRFYIRRFGWQ